jgi:glycosyltransferase involved in cell wall biosynthesis
MNPILGRVRGFVPAPLVSRARRLVGRSEVSQAQLKVFRREMGRRTPASLPREAPDSLALVVPCFRHEAYLSDVFESILSQTRRPDEVIFVDDGSPDATSEILRTFVASREGRDSGRFALLVNDKNLGQAATLNRGISAASSDLIMILNDDDYLMHDAVESMLALFAQHREVALIGAGSIHFVGKEALAAAPKLIANRAAGSLPLVFYQPEDVPRYRNYNDLNMTHSGCCFLKVAWEAVGGYYVDKGARVVSFSDRDFQIRVNSVWPVAVSNETPFTLWRRDSSVDGGLNS